MSDAIKARLPGGEVRFVAARHVRTLVVEQHGETWAVVATMNPHHYERTWLDYSDSRNDAEERAEYLASCIWPQRSSPRAPVPPVETGDTE